MGNHVGTPVVDQQTLVEREMNQVLEDKLSHDAVDSLILNGMNEDIKENNEYWAKRCDADFGILAGMSRVEEAYSDYADHLQRRTAFYLKSQLFGFVLQPYPSKELMRKRTFWAVVLMQFSAMYFKHIRHASFFFANDESETEESAHAYMSSETAINLEKEPYLKERSDAEEEVRPSSSSSTWPSSNLEIEDVFSRVTLKVAQDIQTNLGRIAEEWWPIVIAMLNGTEVPLAILKTIDIPHTDDKILEEIIYASPNFMYYMWAFLKKRHKSRIFEKFLSNPRVQNGSFIPIHDTDLYANLAIIVKSDKYRFNTVVQRLWDKKKTILFGEK